MAAEVSAITGSKRGLTTDLCTLRTSGKVIPVVGSSKRTANPANSPLRKRNNTECDDIVVAGNCGDRAYARGEDGGGSACGEGEDAGEEEEERTTRRYATTNTTPTTEKATTNEVEVDDEEDDKNGEVGGGDSNTPFAYKYGEAGEGNA